MAESCKLRLPASAPRPGAVEYEAGYTARYPREEERGENDGGVGRQREQEGGKKGTGPTRYDFIALYPAAE